MKPINRHCSVCLKTQRFIKKGKTVIECPACGKKMRIRKTNG